MPETSILSLPGEPLRLHAVRRARSAERIKPFEAAMQALGEALGTAFVTGDAVLRAKWSRTTLPQGTTPSAVVRPGSTEDVQAVMRIATRYRLLVHPISTGRNWGYGDACAAADGQILLDLGRLNRVLDVNSELAYATVEPGVTQGQLADELEARGVPLWMDATGAGPDTSLIGNTVERGFGHSPHGDRFQHVCGLEVVLPDGRLLRTGFGHFRNAQSAQVYRWGVGPFLDGLFTQGNFGVVTRMTFWLQPKPEAFRACFFSLKDEARLPDLIEALRPLRLRGTLRTPVHIANDLRMVAMNQRYPWEEMQGATPLAPDLRLRLRKANGIGAWCGSTGLYGSRAEVRAAESEVRRALKRVPGLQFFFVDERKLGWIKRLAGWCKRLKLAKGLVAAAEKMDMGFRLLQGRSPRVCMQGGLWRARNKSAGATDPRDAGAGFLWLSPVLPMTREHLARVDQLVLPIFAKYGFDYQVTLSMVTERALCAVMTVCFDKQDHEDAARARACHDELLAALLEAGYPPYRSGHLTTPHLGAASEVFFGVTAQLKAALDPAGILSPGHYEPGRFTHGMGT